MNSKSLLLPAFVCGFFIIGSVFGIVWYATTPLLRGDIDGLLLLAICVLIGAIFSAQLFSISRRVWSTRLRTEVTFVSLHRTQVIGTIPGLQKTLRVWRQVFSRFASQQGGRENHIPN